VCLHQSLRESQASHDASGAAAKESARARAALSELRAAHHPGLAAQPAEDPAVAAARRYDGPGRCRYLVLAQDQPARYRERFRTDRFDSFQ